MTFPRSINSLLCFFAISMTVCTSFSLAQTKAITVPKPDLAFKSSVKLDNLDPAAYADWVDGNEKPVMAKEEKAKTPQWVLWTDKTQPGHSGVTFGFSKKSGPRHLRIGFHTAIPVGSIIADGGGRPSVLKPGAAYPGNMADETQWIPAKRLADGQVSDKELDKSDYGIWVFPAGTKTRALRFSHVPDASDGAYEGFLTGALLAEERFSNISGQAITSAKSSNQRAKLLNNGLTDNWAAWENIDYKEASPANQPVISAENAEWILLTWAQPVKISGLVALWAGFSAAEAQAFTGPAGQHPRDARENQWQSIAVYSGIVGTTPHLWPNYLDFGKVVTTTSVRLKITAPLKGVGNLKDKVMEGRRVWLGEIMALQSLGNLPLSAPGGALAAVAQLPNPPIAVPFTLKEAGYVTLVIEDKNGMRVRNLISETWFNAGKNVAWWDGLDDLGRDIEAAKHGVYKIPAKFVVPGEYKVRGLVRGEITTTYEFPVYTTGTPPWSTDDHVGGWLANHSAPQAAVFVPAKQSPTGQPAVFLGNYVTEGPDGLAWVDLDGKKLGGKKWIGGAWTAAPYLARDAGEKAATDVYAYVGSVWETGKKSGEAELRITALTAGADKPIILHALGPFAPKASKSDEIGGLAVRDGIAVVSLTKKNQLIFIDVKLGKVLGTTLANAPMGLAFDSKGSLLFLSENKLLKYSNISDINKLPAVQTVISSGLEAPVGLTFTQDDRILISDGGKSHQVKVFTASGKFVSAIGRPGAPKAGPYDPLHMNNPAGITVDAKQQLWVAENDYLPKRVSVWTLDGKLIRSFYGPSKYGGGGTVDPEDKTKFYYSEETKGAMEFALDWQTGENKLKQVIYRKTPGSLDLAFRSSGPETALYYKGKRYFTNCYSSNPTGGQPTAFLFVDRDGIAYPAAAMGRADAWEILKEERFKSVLPADVDLNGKGEKVLAFFMWTDINEDAAVQTNEVSFIKGAASGVTVMSDLSFIIAQLNGKATQFAPVSFSAKGSPVYQLGNAKVLAAGILSPASSGGNQVLTDANGWTVAVQGMAPFHKYSISGAKDGKARWSYPNMWPGLHASHEAPLPSFSGELIGPTRLLGGLMDIKGADSGPLWAVNSNHGMVYVFTTDGLFVATLFEPMRSGKRWRMPVAERGMSLKGVSLGEENFWPSITQTKAGEVYLVDGARSSVVRVDGLKNISRLPVSTLNVTTADLDKSRVYQVKSESQRQKAEGRGVLTVALSKATLVVDGKVDDWKDANWVDIDKSGVKANFNSNSKPYNVTGAVTVSGDKLYVAYRTGDAELLKNTGEMPVAPFKTGGALDLMIGADATAKSDRSSPVAGDIRLLVTLVKGKPKALLYRAVVAGSKAADRVPFASPWRTITFDGVEDVTAQLSFAAGKNGDYEISVPLSVLNLKPMPGMLIKGDIGILRGDGAQTISRVYWSNKATGIVSDVPAEAELSPGLWGTWEFK
ncbi:hypothetical protein LPB86_18975 [Pedobacter sp. MC2016-14]|uniref:hypothetical protein n=1 Tax=Pedobacter sp. MC2016-14 TaxID=2897327 RepID=UPI001E299E40|nr:hypothetical protein [Pedobacter sp. MC2016-14]MCD0490328.1 hypothetical protein [Pedobacter sp. MC2016-14]